MDIFHILFSVFAGLSLLHQVNAGCEQDLKQQPAFNNCVNSYSQYMANAMSSIDQSDPQAMAGVMCSAEGKAAAQCLLDYVNQCPNLGNSTDPNTSSVFASFTALSQHGGLDGHCSMMGPCLPVQQCLSRQGEGAPEVPMNPPTPLSYFPALVKYICGNLRGMLGCFNEVGDQCKDLENNLKMIVDMMKGGLNPGTTLPSYENLKMFTMNDCPNLPSDFSTNTCVKNNLNAESFDKCYENVTMTYPQQNSNISCPAYQAGYNCIKMEVGAKCGWVYSNAFVKITPMFLAGAPTNCKLELVTSGSSQVAVSILTILASVLLALRM